MLNTIPRIKNAIFLAAGLGSRLRPITDEHPKCMTELNNTTILENALTQLHDIGVEKVVIVIGYKGDYIIDAIGATYKGLSIEYIWNHQYDSTNSMYSLWLARQTLEQGAYILEGDIFFGKDFSELMEQGESGRSCWLLDPFNEESSGSMSITDPDGRINEIKIVRESLKNIPSNYFKSTGVLRLGADYGKKLSGWLSDAVNEQNTNVYFDLIIAKHINEAPLYALNVSKTKWFEIDDLLDLRKAEKLFAVRKHVVVVIDGAADYPLDKLEGKTPLEYCELKNINRLAAMGKTGLMQTSFSGLPVGSIVANLGILGYAPTRYYPFGRASFEALAQDIYLNGNDLAFRCNLISLDKDKKIKDFTANNISNEDALKIINNMDFGSEKIELYSGQSYRNILIMRDLSCSAEDINSFEPHANIGMPISDILLKSTNKRSAGVVDTLNRIMLNSIEQIAELNKTHKTDADMLWIWSESCAPTLPSFSQRTSMRGAVVAGLDFMRGIGIAGGMVAKEIHGATGYLDSNFKEKLKYVKNYLRNNDFVFLHVNATDEEAHAKRIDGKIAALKRVDEELIGPIHEYLEEQHPGNYRIAVMPDHYTYTIDGCHKDDPVPYFMTGAGIEGDKVKRYNEREVVEAYGSKPPIKSYHFLDQFLK